MNLHDSINDQGYDWQREPPANTIALEQLQEQANFPLPLLYLEFLRLSNGGEGELGIEPGYFHIWSAEEVLEANHDYNLAEFHPNYFGFGSSLGGVMFAFKKSDHAVYGIPFDSINERDIRLVAVDFLTFVQAMGVIN